MNTKKGTAAFGNMMKKSAMKKLFANISVLFALALFFCSCRKQNSDVQNGQFQNAPLQNQTKNQEKFVFGPNSKLDIAEETASENQNKSTNCKGKLHLKRGLADYCIFQLLKLPFQNIAEFFYIIARVIGFPERAVFPRNLLSALEKRNERDCAVKIVFRSDSFNRHHSASCSN